MASFTMHIMGGLIMKVKSTIPDRISCRIHGDVSDANTKVYGDGSAIFKIFLFKVAIV